MVNQPSEIVINSCELHKRLGPEQLVIGITSQGTKELSHLGATMPFVQGRYCGIACVSVVCFCRIGQELPDFVGLKNGKLFALGLQSILSWQVDYVFFRCQDQ